MKAVRFPAVRAFSRSLGGGAALVAAPAVLAALLLTPPAAGEMLAVPLSGEARTALPALLSRPSIRLLAKGPLEGSFVIHANRSTAREAVAGGDVLLLAVPDAGCIGAAV
ncbi:hypothetical protein [Qipengyuania sp.]|uniref:hypothetical protein n=1 Tax=Qipengyuania sp. TaxID=2004515 RepID=UPI0035C82A96